MIAAVVLAAGASTRLGWPKQLLHWEGEPLLHRAARLALAAGCHPVHVILPANPAPWLPALQGLAVRPIANPLAEEGLGASLRLGAQQLGPEAEAVLVLTVDQVRVDEALLQALIALWRGAPDRPAACFYGDRPGIPALFPAPLFQALRALEGDRGAKGLLGRASLLPFAGGVDDVDSPADVVRLGLTKGR